MIKSLFDRYSNCSYMYGNPLTNEEYLQLRTSLQKVLDACLPFGSWTAMVCSFATQNLSTIESTLHHRGVKF